MPLTQPLYEILPLKTQANLSPNHKSLLEGKAIDIVITKLEEHFNKENYSTSKYKIKSMENKSMQEMPIHKIIIQDILDSGEYTLKGIALYTRTDEELIYDIISGINSTPSLVLFRRLVNIHKTVRPNLYKKILPKK